MLCCLISFADPHLGATQLWVQRTLQHMEAATKMSVDGALLITWRMEAVGPTIWALSHKSWNASLSADDAWAGWASGEFELNRSAALKVGAGFAALEGAEQSLHMAGCPGFAVRAGPSAAGRAGSSGARRPSSRACAVRIGAAGP